MTTVNWKKRNQVDCWYVWSVELLFHWSYGEGLPLFQLRIKFNLGSITVCEIRPNLKNHSGVRISFMGYSTGIHNILFNEDQ